MLDLHFCAGKWGLLSIAVHGLLIALAFSCCRAHALGHMGFSDCSSWALEHRFNSFGTQVQLLCGMWYLPGSGIKLVSPALASSLPLSHHGNPYILHFKSIFHCEIICVYGMKFWLCWPIDVQLIQYYRLKSWTIWHFITFSIYQHQLSIAEWSVSRFSLLRIVLCLHPPDMLYCFNYYRYTWRLN